MAIKSTGLGRILSGGRNDYSNVITKKPDLKNQKVKLYDADQELLEKFIEAGILKPEKQIEDNDVS